MDTVCKPWGLGSTLFAAVLYKEVVAARSHTQALLFTSEGILHERGFEFPCHHKLADGRAKDQEKGQVWSRAHWPTVPSPLLVWGGVVCMGKLMQQANGTREDLKRKVSLRGNTVSASESGGKEVVGRGDPLKEKGWKLSQGCRGCMGGGFQPMTARVLGTQ